MPDPLLPPDLIELLGRQDGVLSRQQATASGLAGHDVRRLVRQRAWVVLHRGVYVTHTGQVSWRQLAWGAVLGRGPAALFGVSALRAVEHPDGWPASDEMVHVGVDRRHGTPAPRERVQVHHVARLAETVLWQARPPRQRYEAATIEVATSAPDELARVAVLARACSSRRTTPARLRGALDARGSAPDRRMLLTLIRDVEDGTCSALEHAFLTRVERPHGLPRALRQQRGRGRTGVVYRDATYGDAVHVELDGLLFHDGPRQRDRDHDRDLDALVDGRRTARLTYGQVIDRPCRTALQVGRLLQRAGIEVALRACGPGCDVAG